MWRLAGALLLPLPAAAVRIGDASFPIAGGNVVLSGEVQYGRVEAVVTAAPLCSGLRAQLALTRPDHAIVLALDQRLMAGRSEIRNSTGELVASATWEPPADPWRDDVSIAIEWTSSLVTWYAGGTAVANFTTPTQNVSHPYQLPHSISLGLFPCSHAGRATTACGPHTFRVRNLTVSSYDQAARTFTTASTWLFNTQCASAGGAGWSGWSSWSRNNTLAAPGTGLSGLLLKSACDCDSTGLTLTASKITFPYNASGSNLAFQDTSGPLPWAMSLDGTAVAKSRSDPYCRTSTCADGGQIAWDIVSSGIAATSIATRQTLGPLPLASSTTEPEFCLILWMSSTWQRDVSVELDPVDSYFPVAAVTVNVSSTQLPYSVCFLSTSGGQTYLVSAGDGGVRNVPLTIGFGAVGGVIFNQHTVALSRAGIWSVALSNATVGWTDNLAQEQLTNPGFDDSSGWAAQIQTAYGAAAVMAASGGEYRITISSAGTNASDIRLFQSAVLLEAGATYRISMRAMSEGATRLVRVAVWDQDGVTTHGGLLIVKLTTSFASPFEHTFVAEQTTQVAGSAAGSATIALDVGGADYNAPSNATVVVDYLHLRKWTGTTLESALPAAAPDAAAAPPTPPTPIPTVSIQPPPATAPNATPQPTPDAAALWPQTTMSALLGAVYSSPAYAVPFKGILIEQIDVAGLRTYIAGNLVAQCGLLSTCDRLGVQNVEVLAICHSTLNAPNGEPGYSADLRACRGLGSAISYFRTATTNHTVYAVFTFVGLTTDVAGLAERTVASLNRDLRLGAVNLHGLPLDAQVVVVADPAARTPVPPGGQLYGMENWQWSVIVGLVSTCSLSVGFLIWFQHGMWKRRDAFLRYDVGRAFLEAQREEMERAVSVAVRGKGMLPLDKVGTLKRRFDEIDTDGGGTIDKKEFRDMFYRLTEEKKKIYEEWYTYEDFMKEETEVRGEDSDDAAEKWDSVPTRYVQKAIHIDDGEFENFYQEIDKDGNEEIDFTEFSEGFIPYFTQTQTRGQARAAQRRRRGVHNTVQTANETRLGMVLQALEAGNTGNTLFDEDAVIDEKKREDQGCLAGCFSNLEQKASSIVQKAAEEKHSRVQGQSVMKELELGDHVIVTTDKELYAEYSARHLSYAGLAQPHDADDVLGRMGQVIEVGARDAAGSPRPEPRVSTEPADVSDGEDDLAEELNNLVYVRFHATSLKPGVNFWIHPRVLACHRANPVEDWMSLELRRHTRNMERNMVIRAVIAGMISAGLAAVAEMFAETYYGEGSTSSQTDTSGGSSFISIGGSTKWQYWVIILVPMIGLSIAEIAWLYRDALLTTMRISRHFGLVLYPANEERQFWADALARACLELGNPVKTPICGQQWAIDPSREITPFWRAVRQLVYKAKSGPLAFAVKVLAKRLVSRIGAKAAQSYFAVPIIMAMNGIVAKLVLHNARVIALSTRLITKLTDCQYDPVPSWYLSSHYVVIEHFEKLRVQILRAIGCVVVARREWHPSLEFLYKIVRRKLGVVNTDTEKLAIKAAENKTSLEWGDDPAEDLTLRRLMRRDCCVHYDMDLLPKLLDALEYKYETVEDRKRVKEEETARDEVEADGQAGYTMGRTHDEYMSDSSSEWDYIAHTVGFTDDEKKLILRHMVLAVIVSGRPDHRTRALLRLAFTRASFTNPGDMIDDLNYWFEDGNMEQVVKFMDKELFLPRTVRQGQSVGFTRRIENFLYALVDW